MSTRRKITSRENHERVKSRPVFCANGRNLRNSFNTGRVMIRYLSIAWYPKSTALYIFLEIEWQTIQWKEQKDNECWFLRSKTPPCAARHSMIIGLSLSSLPLGRHFPTPRIFIPLSLRSRPCAMHQRDPSVRSSRNEIAGDTREREREREREITLLNAIRLSIIHVQLLKNSVFGKRIVLYAPCSSKHVHSDEQWTRQRTESAGHKVYHLIV